MANIVIGMDESNGAAAALRWAVREGERRAWPVTAVLAWSFLDQHHAEPGQEFDPAYSGAAAERALAVTLEAAVGAEAAATVGRRVVCDLPARALLDASDDADLLVVGARGIGGFRRLLLGSVSQHILHHATCPVAVVRAPSGGTGDGGAGGTSAGLGSDRQGRVVVGIDGSAISQRAFRWAVEAARARDATVEVVHAWQAAIGTDPYFAVPVDQGAMAESGRLLLDRVIDAERTTDLPPLEERVVNGSAAATLLDAASEACLVVVGTRGTGGFAGLLLGSVSQTVARHAPCPVVVIPGERTPDR